MQDLISYLKVRLWLHMHGYDCALHIEDDMCLMRLGCAHAKSHLLLTHASFLQSRRRQVEQQMLGMLAVGPATAAKMAMTVARGPLRMTRDLFRDRSASALRLFVLDSIATNYESVSIMSSRAGGQIFVR